MLMDDGRMDGFSFDISEKYNLFIFQNRHFVSQVKKNSETVGAVPEVAAWMAQYKK